MRDFREHVRNYLQTAPGTYLWAGGSRASNPGAQVHFANRNDGGRVTSPVRVIIALLGMGVAPVGTEKDNTGHHNLYVDRPPFGEGEGAVAEFSNDIPADEHHVHFDGGQTKTVVNLIPGPHHFTDDLAHCI